MNILVVTLKNPPLGSEQSFSEISTHAVTNHLDEIYNYLAVGWVGGQRFGIGWLWHVANYMSYERMIRKLCKQLLALRYWISNQLVVD